MVGLVIILKNNRYYNNYQRVMHKCRSPESLNVIWMQILLCRFAVQIWMLIFYF